MKVTFVILHFMALGDTIECINSIQNNILSKAEISLVIVDNASPDNSFQELLKLYGKVNNIHLIQSDSNLGFAKGNNLGFRFAKKKLAPDFIVMVNNDTVIEQGSFCDLIIEEYKRKYFDIAGPNIISLKGSINQNPIAYEKPQTSDIFNRIRKYKILKLACIFNADKVVHKVYGFLKRNQSIAKNDTDFKLHGSCLIFSKKYIEQYDGLYPKTFMYGEEDILKWISIRDHLTMVYLKDISIYHKEDASTDVVFRNDKKKRQFYYKWNIDSLEILKLLMEKGN